MKVVIYRKMQTEFSRLVGWLKANGGRVGRTLPMPLVDGKKIPLVKHTLKGDWTWTWDKLDAFLRSHPAAERSGGWGLLLDRLCVVDADSAEAVAWLEGLGLPELERCPMQVTAKGRHYFFARPAWADDDGYYDGARQMKDACRGSPESKVDFKTRCSTGSGGVLVVTPTPGKRWAEGRAPWDAGVALEEAPKALVERVAQPRKVQPRRASAMTAQQEPVALPNVEALPSVRDADIVVKVLHLLSKTRWDDYGQWRDIATALKNDGGDKYKAEWLRLSRASTKFEADAAEKLWGTVARTDYDGPRVTVGTLRKWAAHDDPVGYQAARAATVAPLVLANYSEGDRGLAEIAAHMLRDVVKRVGTKGDVYFFKEEECRWCRGDEASILLTVSYAVEEALRDVDAHLSARAAATRDDAERQAVDETRKQVTDRIKYIRKRTGMSNVTHLAARLCQDDGFEQRLDSIPHLLGVRNGVVDLRSGQLRRRRPEDMLFTLLDVDYNPTASTKLIDATVLSMMADDAVMAFFLQKLLGYGVTGEVCEEIFLVFTASGRNGKGLLMQAMRQLLGTMYVELNCGIITCRQVANLDAEHGKLLGARVAVFNELEPGEKLKTSEVQLLSGGDGVPATPKYRDPMTIEPRHLCILTTNHLPQLAEVIVAIVERFLVVPFPVTFVDLAEGEAPTATRRQRDNDLKQRLMNDREGFLRWLVVGAVAWYATKDLKRNAPEKVKEFSRRYFADQDRVTSFMSDRCTVGEGQLVPTVALHAALLDWCQANQKQPVAADALAKSMKEKGFEKKKSRYPGYKNPVQCYHGIGVVPEDGYESG